MPKEYLKKRKKRPLCPVALSVLTWFLLNVTMLYPLYIRNTPVLKCSNALFRSMCVLIRLSLTLFVIKSRIQRFSQEAHIMGLFVSTLYQYHYYSLVLAPALDTLSLFCCTKSLVQIGTSFAQGRVQLSLIEQLNVTGSPF